MNKGKVKSILKKSKKYLIVLVLAFILGSVAGLAYKFGAMHSFFQTVNTFAGSELICNETAKMHNSTEYIDGVCYSNYSEEHCWYMEGIPTMAICQEEKPDRWDKFLVRLMSGRRLVEI